MDVLKRNTMLSVLALMFCTMTVAQSVTKPAFKQAKALIIKQYVADKAACIGLTGHLEAMCKLQAIGQANIAIASLEEAFRPSSTAHYHTLITQAKVAYAVAKLQCEVAEFKDHCLMLAREANIAANEQAEFMLKTSNRHRDVRRVMA